MVKWNQDLRRIMYVAIKREYGPISSWKRMTNPPGDRQEYHRFLEKLISALSLISGRSYTRGAVENQIAWGTQKGQKECKAKGFLASFILNRAAALDAGLITIGDIPNSASFISDARV